MLRHHARAGRRSCSPCPAPSAAGSPTERASSVVHAPAASTTMSASTSPAAVRTRGQPVALRHELDHLGALADLDAVAAQHVRQAGRDRVGPHVPVLADREPGASPSSDSAGSSSCSSAPVMMSSGSVVAVLAHRLQACAARRARRRALRAAYTMPCLWSSHSTPSARISSTRSKMSWPRLRDRRRAVGVVALVAVRPEPQQPRRERGAVAGCEVQRRVAVEQRAHAVQRQPRLGQRAGLRRAQPAAVRERGAAADPVALDDRHVEVAAAQVVGARQARDAAADDRPTLMLGSTSRRTRCRKLV